MGSKKEIEVKITELGDNTKLLRTHADTANFHSEKLRYEKEIKKLEAQRRVLKWVLDD